MSGLTRQEAEQAITHIVRDTDEEKNSAYLDAQHALVEIKGRKQFFALQNGWSTAIIIWISGLIIFNAALSILVGTGCLDFSKAPWFVTAVTVETFLQVVGLGYVAARYLFSNEQNPSRKV